MEKLHLYIIREGKIPWSRAWQPTPVFSPGESHGQRSLAGYRPRGCEESDTTERLGTAQLVAQMERNLSAMQETWFGCLG